MKHKSQDEKIQKKAAPDPIIDGDARPDMPLTPGNESGARVEKKSKTTVNRADQDSREDFKDAKHD
jgi:hypothetical protein